MYRSPKENSRKEVVRRIGKLDETINDLLAMRTEGLIPYELESEQIQKSVLLFLKDAGVPVDLTEPKILLDDCDQHGHDIIERTCRLSNKVLKKHYEETDPVPVLETILNVVSPFQHRDEIINIMNTISDSLSLDQSNVMIEEIRGLDAKLEEYRVLLEKTPQEHQGSITLQYKSDLTEYFVQMKKVLEDSYIQNRIDRHIIKAKIDDAEIDLFNYDSIRSSDDVEIQAKNQQESNNIPSSLIEKWARTKDTGGEVEQEYGTIVAVRFSKPRNLERRQISLHTNGRDGQARRWVIKFDGSVDSFTENYIHKLCDIAENNKYGGNPDFKSMTLKTRKCIQQGFLTD